MRNKNTTFNSGRFINLIWDLSLAMLFFKIMLDPTAFDHFLYRNGFVFLMVEFITIHSTLFFFAFSARPIVMVFLFVFYSVFAGAGSIIIGNIWVFVYFWFSTITKVISYRKGDEKIKENVLGSWIFTMVVFLLSMGVSLVVLPVLHPMIHAVLNPEQPFVSYAWDELANLAGDEKSNVSGSPPIYIAYWMMTYFLLCALGDLFGDKIKSKIGKSQPNLAKNRVF